MNSLVVQQHHQKVQIRSQNLMLKQLLATDGVNVSLQIPDVPDISSVTDISTSSTSDMPHPPTFQHLPRHFLPKNDGKNELVPYKIYLMSLIYSVMSNRKKGRPKLILIFLFWFEEDFISLYNEFNLEKISVIEKKEKYKAMRKNFHNLKSTVRGILLF